MKHEEDYEMIREPEKSSEDERQTWKKSDLTRQERRWFALGALKSGLLIGLVYLVGLGLAILLMTLLRR